MPPTGERSPASGEAEAGPGAGGGATALLLVWAAIAVGVVLMALVQFRFVLELPLRPAVFVLPTLVGVTIGALVASIRAARRRERSTARQLAAAQEARFEAMQRLAGGVGHDLANVFAVAAACSESVRQVARNGGAGPCARCVDVLEDVDAALERARGISRQLVMLARPRAATAEPIDAAAVIRAVAPVLRRVAGSAVRLEVAAEEPVHVRIDRTELEQVALNLATNGRDAMPGGGTLRVRVAREGSVAVLGVRDTGLGMDGVTRARMFEPFFTTKPAGKGTGLGLMVVAHVVERAGGRIAVRSAPGEGTEVAISFPASDVAAAGESRAV